MPLLLFLQRAAPPAAGGDLIPTIEIVRGERLAPVVGIALDPVRGLPLAPVR